MPEHKNFPFNTLHRFIFDTGLSSALPANPEGLGDVYFSSDTTELNVADGAGTAWEAFDISSIASNAFSVLAGPTRLTVGAASLTISGIPQTHYELEAIFQLRGNLAGGVGTYPLIQFNGDTGANYMYYAISNPTGVGSHQFAGSAANNYIPPDETMAISTNAANSHGYLKISIKDYANNTKYKVGFVHAGRPNGTLVTHINHAYGAFLWRDTDAITEISITPFAGTQVMANSTFVVYGYGTAL